MKRPVQTVIAVLLAGCATSGGPAADDAVEDFIVVSELVEQDMVRTRGHYYHAALSDRYIILSADREEYLVKFNRSCTELTDLTVTPDVRRERNVIRARFDTIRGCRIHRIYAIDKGQAEELRQLGSDTAARR